MDSKKIKTIIPYMISFLLGCAAYYVFLCFTGVVMAFITKVGADSSIVHTFIKPLPSGDMRKLAFSIYFNITHILVGLIVLFTATYFFQSILQRRY
jgi:uncharacterized membrane protein